MYLLSVPQNSEGYDYAEKGCQTEEMNKENESKQHRQFLVLLYALTNLQHRDDVTTILNIICNKADHKRIIKFIKIFANSQCCLYKSQTLSPPHLVVDASD